MMRQIVEVADKAVSTDDLVPVETDSLQKSISDVARLETVLAALVENKVVAIRTENEKNASSHSSPIALLAGRIHRRFRSNSSSSSDRLGAARLKLSVDNVRNAEEAGARAKRQQSLEADEVAPQDDSERRELVGSERSRRRGDRDEPPARCWHEREPCLLPNSPELHGGGVGDACSAASLGEECVVVLERERARTRTRRKRRRHRRRARALIMEAVEERVKVLDPDELPQRARWTIMITACLLLFLCLLLVGVTLRMAPLIDDMVRQENERIIQESYQLGMGNSSQPMAAQRKSPER